MKKSVLGDTIAAFAVLLSAALLVLNEVHDLSSPLTFYCWVLLLIVLFVCRVFKRPAVLFSFLQNTRNNLISAADLQSKVAFYSLSVILWVLVLAVFLLWNNEFNKELTQIGRTYFDEIYLYCVFTPLLITACVVSGWFLLFVKVVAELVLTPVYFVTIGCDIMTEEMTLTEAKEELRRVLHRKRLYYSRFFPARQPEGTKEAVNE